MQFAKVLAIQLNYLYENFPRLLPCKWLNNKRNNLNIGYYVKYTGKIHHLEHVGLRSLSKQEDCWCNTLVYNQLPCFDQGRNNSWLRLNYHCKKPEAVQEDLTAFNNFEGFYNCFYFSVLNCNCNISDYACKLVSP